MDFIGGKKLTLRGTAPTDQRKEIYDFEAKLRKETSTNGDLIFDPSKGEHVNYTVQGGNVRWNFSLELNRAEIE